MRHVSSSSSRGYTLVEMVVTLAIVSLLAAVALPYAKVIHVRNKEMELKRALREVRTALDAFHSDWEKGALSSLEGEASRDGYPRKLEILVRGVSLGGQIEGKRKYLRRIPTDPFGDPSTPAATQWQYIGYRDAPDTEQWSREDVYDVRSRSERQALNGSYYRDW